MAKCFHEVVDFFSNSRKANFSLKAAERRGGVSFANAVKKAPPLVLTGMVLSKNEGRSTVASGRIISRSHAKKEDVHAVLGLTFQVSRQRLLMNVWLVSVWVFFCVKHLHLRLSTLKMEMDRLLNSLDKLGYFGLGEFGSKL